jgi:hypothetical protein
VDIEQIAGEVSHGEHPLERGNAAAYDHHALLGRAPASLSAGGSGALRRWHRVLGPFELLTVLGACSP